MTIKFTRLVIIACCLGTLCPRATAQVISGEPFRRWGVGWDDGIGIRYLLDSSWGLGFQARPSWRRGTSNIEEITDSVLSYYMPVSTLRRESFTVSGTLFWQKQLGRWFTAGPYVRIGYSFDQEKGRTRRISSVEDWNDTQMNTVHTASAEIGIRPTFVFEKRFVLETRFGLVSTWYWYDRRRSTIRNSASSSSHTSTRDWQLFLLGRDLGPGAIMQFIIYL